VWVRGASAQLSVNQGENGVGVPGDHVLRRGAGTAPQARSSPRIGSRSSLPATTIRADAARAKRAVTSAWRMTERQGGSDLRRQFITTAPMAEANTSSPGTSGSARLR